MKEFSASIDRFEGNKAVIITEDNYSFVLPRKLLPKAVKEGDLLNFIIKSNKIEGLKLKKKLDKMINRLSRKGL